MLHKRFYSRLALKATCQPGAQGDITAAQQYFADGQAAMQQALADAQHFGQQTRDLRGQQSQLQSSIAVATAVGQNAQQESVLLGMFSIRC